LASIRESALTSLRFPTSRQSMKWLGSLLLLLLLAGQALCDDLPADWQAWERAVRDGRLPRGEGRSLLEAWEKRLVEAYPDRALGRNVCFPLPGYGLKDIGGRAGDGYLPSGYDFLDGNRHGGHPAHDIFIYDRNRDGLEDGTRRPADVVALAEGVVLSTFREWGEGGEVREIRGGNYLWVYHPAQRIFSYYAHLQEIIVAAGDRVGCGQKLATLGRTGKNACRTGSPTHLHLMVLRAQGMMPVDSFPILKTKSWLAMEK
jgi:peptidoglycan LD-endopeptidase LytH